VRVGMQRPVNPRLGACGVASACGTARLASKPYKVSNRGWVDWFAALIAPVHKCVAHLIDIGCQLNHRAIYFPIPVPRRFNDYFCRGRMPLGGHRVDRIHSESILATVAPGGRKDAAAARGSI